MVEKRTRRRFTTEFKAQARSAVFDYIEMHCSRKSIDLYVKICLNSGSFFCRNRMLDGLLGEDRAFSLEDVDAAAASRT